VATPKELFGVLGFVVAVLLVVRVGLAQEVKVLSTGDGNVVTTSEVAAESSAAPAGATKPDESKPGDKPEKADEEKKKAEEKKDEAGKEKAQEEKEAEETPKPIQRPSTPPKPPDPEQLKIRPDEEGKIRFNFIGQPWPEVLEWFADISQMSLDWQEVPGDYLNLTTLQSYNLDEARDLINRHLLARGFTLLRHGEVFSVVNSRQNSILAHAPPDKMAIIMQAVLAIDQPADVGHSLLAAMERMQIYRLAAIDPKPLVETLEKMGGLHPSTRLEVDEQNRAIIAYATAADHFTIGRIVEKLDGSGRSFRVITLRKHDAEMVAGTIQAMLAGEAEKRPENVRYYYDYGSSSRGRGESEADKDQFRVEADVEQNRLLLRANDLEYQEVLDLLVQLGEIPPEGGNPSRIRVLDGYWDEKTEAWIERVFEAWPSVAPNPLIPPTKQSGEKPPDPAPDEESPRDESTPEDTETQALPAAARDGDSTDVLFHAGVDGGRRPGATRSGRPVSPQVQFVQLKQPAVDAEAASPAKDATRSPGDATPPSEEDRPDSPAPIRISRDPDGRLVLTSEDTKALDLLEGLMERLAPPQEDYKIFQLEYAWAYGVALTLQEIFEEEEKESSRPRYPYYYYYDYYDTGGGSDDTRRMSKRRPLKFISDPDSNSILVQNADPAQLKKIEELIEFYDQPEPVKSQSVRKTQIFHLRYAKAAVIAEAVKDVYRDLLSSNDKALVSAQKGQQAPRESYTFVYDSGGGERQEQMIPRYEGSLSIGINELSNTLVVSARAYLLEDISQIIEELDEAAKPAAESVYLLQVGNGLDATEIQKKLSRVLSGPTSGRQSSERQTRRRGEPSGTSGSSPRRRSSR